MLNSGTWSRSQIPLSAIWIQQYHRQDVTSCFSDMLLLSPLLLLMLPSFREATTTEEALGINVHWQYSLSMCIQNNIMWIYICHNVDLQRSPWELNAELNAETRLRNPGVNTVTETETEGENMSWSCHQNKEKSFNKRKCSPQWRDFLSEVSLMRDRQQRIN